MKDVKELFELLLVTIYMIAYTTMVIMASIIVMSIWHPNELVDLQALMVTSLMVFLIIHRKGYDYEHK